MSKSAARLALVCALVGLAASVAAAYVHYHLLFDPSYTSFCDVNSTFNCAMPPGGAVSLETRIVVGNT